MHAVLNPENSLTHIGARLVKVSNRPERRASGARRRRHGEDAERSDGDETIHRLTPRMDGFACGSQGRRWRDSFSFLSLPRRAGETRPMPGLAVHTCYGPVIPRFAEGEQAGVKAAANILVLFLTFFEIHGTFCL